ncbi:helix-turn-helix domain-containing protein [Roseinatronobacter alkalisoli]|uniref:Helix-turn-helix domain-containing protein n=1 Tax=Roseinatronobacter alkalisoli TaxID=3028235 RepID=A0ABT5TAR4_9RHOB|nr:helix-turn-helix domain-containing protein [Roseinatronobacter sp. HJB301]MDD7972034.1 helix-turn-helix domain-containing protein [Roseinatronobacter sp. HJB301]
MTDSHERRAARHPVAKAKRAGTSFRAVSTKSQRPSQRFEFWRSLFPRIDLDTVEEDGQRDFRGNLLHFGTEDGATFVFSSNDDTRASFGRPEGDFLMLSLTVAGSAKLQHGHDTRLISTPGTGLVIVDGGQAFTTISRDHSVISLMLPRDRAERAIGNDLSVLRNGLVSLPQEGMAHLLTSHLQTMAMEGESLDGHSADIAMKAAVDMAFGALTQAKNREDGQTAIPTGHDAGLRAAARRYIHLHCQNHKLTAAGIARAIGCSRAHLYRVFAAKEISVGDVLRTARLERASALLITFADMPVKFVASRCGYADAAAFARAFRGYNGMTPQEYRELFRR